MEYNINIDEISDLAFSFVEELDIKAKSTGIFPLEQELKNNIFEKIVLFLSKDNADFNDRKLALKLCFEEMKSFCDVRAFREVLQQTKSANSILDRLGKYMSDLSDNLNEKLKSIAYHRELTLNLISENKINIDTKESSVKSTTNQKLQNKGP